MPVSPITSFFPTEDVNICFQVIEDLILASRANLGVAASKRAPPVEFQSSLYQLFRHINTNGHKMVAATTEKVGAALRRNYFKTCSCKLSRLLQH
jgi:hypothetical protein